MGTMAGGGGAIQMEVSGRRMGEEEWVKKNEMWLNDLL